MAITLDITDHNTLDNIALLCREIKVILSKTKSNCSILSSQPSNGFPAHSRIKGKTLIFPLDALPFSPTPLPTTSLSPFSLLFSAGYNVLKRKQACCHLRPFARAVISAWNSSLRYQHGPPPHFLCLMLSLRPSLAMECKIVSPLSPHIPSPFFLLCFSIALRSTDG